jgi:hypothetical protein
MKIVLHSIERRDDGLIDLAVSLGDYSPKTYSASYAGSQDNHKLGGTCEDLFFVLSHHAHERFGNCAVYQMELMGILGAFDRGEQLPEMPAQLGTTSFCTLRPNVLLLARDKLTNLLYRMGMCGVIQTSPYNSNLHMIKPGVPFRSRKATATCKKAWRKLFALLSKHDVNAEWGDVALWVLVAGSADVSLSPRSSNKGKDDPKWDSPPVVSFSIDGHLPDTKRSSEIDKVRHEFYDWINAAIIESFRSRTIQKLYRKYNPSASPFSVFCLPQDSEFRHSSLRLLWSNEAGFDAEQVRVEFNGRILGVNEPQPYSDPFSEIMDRYDDDRPEEVIHELQELAEAGHVDAAYEVAGILARPGPYHDPESAYKWYNISLSQQGYSVEFKDENHTPPYYSGPVGDFRNESMVSELTDMLGFDKIHSLDAEAARWLAERKQSMDPKGNRGRALE